MTPLTPQLIETLIWAYFTFLGIGIFAWIVAGWAVGDVHHRTRRKRRH